MKGIVLYVLKKMKKILVFYEFSKLCIMRGYSFRWFYLILYTYIYIYIIDKKIIRLLSLTKRTV